MIKLSKIFSREKGIWYAYVWNESDRMGFEKYLEHKVKNSLFVRENNKLTVWYDSKETEAIGQKIKDKFLYDKEFVDKIFQDLEYEWSQIGKYIEHNRKIKSANELRRYYIYLVKWWSAMNILFRLDLSGDLSKPALEYREKAEKFSDKMIEVWDNFWSNKEKHLQEVMNLVIPKEAFAIDSLSNRKIAQIASRKKGVALLNGILYPLDKIGGILKENKLKLEKEIIEDVTEFQGSVAFKGVAKGLAKIVLFRTEISRIGPGDILVADMTRPDFLPAMKKAAAFITDEGGITCHAAIVARELKKPCIIGTKIATQVLKDGDLVEVDAEKGVVRIIKRKK